MLPTACLKIKLVYNIYLVFYVFLSMQRKFTSFLIYSSLTCFAVLYAVVGFAQPSGKQMKHMFDIGGGNYKVSGWHFAPGFTYMIPTLNQRNEFMTTDDIAKDTLFSGNFNAGGKFGIYAEVGRHRFFERKLLTYMDYGVGFKSLKGTESFVGQLGGDSTRMDYTYDESFKNSFVTGFVNFSNIAQLSDNTFLQNSLGLNVDYRLINRQNEVLIQTQEPQPESLIGQVHYKIGFGFKVNRNLFVVPTVETPILNVWKWQDGKSTLDYFNSDYRPIIFTLRFFWFDIQKQADCVGSAPSTSNSSLWGKDMKRGGKRKKR